MGVLVGVSSPPFLSATASVSALAYSALCFPAEREKVNQWEQAFSPRGRVKKAYRLRSTSHVLP